MSKKFLAVILAAQIAAQLGLQASPIAEYRNHMKLHIDDIYNLVNNQAHAGKIKRISTLPVVLDKPGNYVVAHNLVYDGTNAAIRVTADNVHIDFQNHKLTLIHEAAVGIHAEDVESLQLQNIHIAGETLFKTATSAAIHLVNVTRAHLESVYTKNSTKGIFIEHSNSILVTNSQAEAHEGMIQVIFPAPATLAGTGNGGGIWVTNSENVGVDRCSFIGADLPFEPSRSSFGLHIDGDSKNIIVTNSSFLNWFGSIHAPSCTGLVIDHCSANNSQYSNFNVVQLGAAAAGMTANDVIIRDSCLIQTGKVQGFDGLLLLGGSGYLLENLIIDTASLEIANGYQPAALHIGYPNCAAVRDVHVKGSVIKGAAPKMLFIEHGEHIVFDECRISDGTEINVAITGGLNCTIKNSAIFNGTNGIVLDSPAGRTNSIIDCLVFDHTACGINVKDKNPNYLTGNMVWANRIGIHFSHAGFSAALSNSSYNNQVTNCYNLNQVQMPGAAQQTVGANICAAP